MKFPKLLILDLDETLVHTVPFDDLSKYPCAADFVISEGFAVFKRPGVQGFLNNVLEDFKAVMVWTAGTEDYAKEVLPHLCDIKKLSTIWGRDRCTVFRDLKSFDVFHLKNIKKVKKLGYSSEEILAVDDIPENYHRSYGNVIRVTPFEGDPLDNELPLLYEYLCKLGPLGEIRSINKWNWKTDLST